MSEQQQQDYSTEYDPSRYEIVNIELPVDVIESINALTYLVPEENINGTYAWVLRVGIKAINDKIENGLI